MVNELMEALKARGFKVSLNDATMENPTKHIVISKNFETDAHSKSIKAANEARKVIHQMVTKYLQRTRKPIGEFVVRESHLPDKEGGGYFLEIVATIHLDRSREFIDSIDRLYRDANRD